MKPMLAAKLPLDAQLDSSAFPLLASPKLDGIRALMFDGQLVSRTLKPIPNKYLQKKAVADLASGLDGELIVGDPTAEDAFRKTSSGVMSQDGKPNVFFHVFDFFQVADLPFVRRFDMVQEHLDFLENGLGVDWIKLVEHIRIDRPEELLAYEEKCLALGYEGIMVRSLNGPYKFGRSTFKEGHLLKIKRFEDSEAVVLEAIELMHNENEQTRDNLGGAARSNHKAGMRGGNVLGALKVRDIHTGVEFDIGSGFTAEQRKWFWIDKPIGRTVVYRFFPTGSKDKPRFPVFHGFRDPDIDL